MKKGLLMTLAGVGLAVAGVAMSKKDKADECYEVETVEGEVIDETDIEESVVEE